MSKKKILFFTPTLNRTGSEVALFNLMSECTDFFEMNIVTYTTGILVDELPPAIKHQAFKNLYPYQKTYLEKLFTKLSLRNYPEDYILNKIKNDNPSDIWYVNTLTMPEVVNYANKNRIPVILHIHELEQMYAQLSRRQFQISIETPSLILACSKTCADLLKISGRISNLEISNPSINFAKIDASIGNSLEIRKKNNISNDDFIWLMSGTMDVNKNPSVFLDVAYLLLKHNANVNFMWIANGNEENGYITFCKRKAVQLGIDKRVHWIEGLQTDYYDHFNACDGFVLTSTKESFSMVTVEALYLGKPIASFNCGGVNEIVNNKTGIIIDNYGVKELVNAMIEIMNKSIGFDKAFAKSSVRNFDVKIQAYQWREIINSYF